MTHTTRTTHRTLPSLLALPALAVLLATAAAGGAVPLYPPADITLAVRSQTGAIPAFNLPAGWTFTSSTPALNASGQIALKVSGNGGTDQGIWLGTAGPPAAGSIRATGPADSLLSDPSINAAGLAVYEQTFGAPNGLHQVPFTAGAPSLFTALPAGATGWAGPKVNDAGQAAYRAQLAGGKAIVRFNGGVATPLATEAGAGGPLAFVFLPAFNNAGQVAAKVATSDTGHNEIRLYNTDGTSRAIARDKATDPASHYTAFDNGIGLNDNGQVAFIATIDNPVSASQNRVVVLSDGTTSRVIATRGTGIVGGNIESFAPAVNACGVVAFRAFETATFRAIFAGDGTGLVRVAGQFDPVATDLGAGILARTDTSPAFGGGLAINARGDIAFNASVTAAAGAPGWGAGVFVARATPPAGRADFNADGEVNGNDISDYINAWYSDIVNGTALLGDFNADGETNGNDISDYINSWYAAISCGGACC